MTTAYTSLLGLALPVTGELSGTWGDTVNTAITSLLDTAVAGTTSITTDADITLTTTTGASNQARQAILLWNPASGTTTRYITAPAQSKLYTVINASGGTQSIVIRGAGPTTGVTIAKGESAMVAWNGSDFVKVSSSGGALTLTDLTVTGNTILGDAAADTLTVNATTTHNAPTSFAALVNLPSTGRSAAAALTVTAPAFLYGVASTYTDTASSGTISAMAPFYSIARPTLSTSNVTTYTNAATLYIANAPAAGGSATITNPYSLYVAAGDMYFGGNLRSNLTFSADNTYDIGASGATRPRSLYLGTNLNVAGTAGVGTAATSDVSLRVTRTATGDAQYGILNSTSYGGTATNTYGILNQANIAASAAITSYTGFLAVQAALGAGAAVTSQYGFAVDTSLTGATNNYAFSSSLAAATGRWNFYAAGTAANYFAGTVNIGSTGSVGTNGILTVYETTNARIFLTDSTIGTTYGGQVRGYGVGGSGGFVSIGAVDANVYNEAVIVTSQANQIQFKTTSGVNGTTTERGRVDANGNWLFGGTYNPNGYRMIVAGDLGLYTTNDTAGTTTLRLGSSTSMPQGIASINGAKTAAGGGEMIFSTASGGVLQEVGRFTGAGLFKVSNTASNTVTLTTGASISFTNSTNTSGFDVGLLGGASDAQAYIYQRANASLVFATSNTEVARFSSNGNFMVGTSTAIGNITLSGADTAAIKSSIRNTNTSATLEMITGGTAAYAISSWQYAGIVEGTSGNGATNALVLSAYNGPMVFQTNSRTEAARFNSSGQFLVSATNNAGGNLALFMGSGGTTIRVGSSDNAQYRGYEIGAGQNDGNSYASFMAELNGGRLRIRSGYAGFGGFTTFETNGAERMRIDTNGRISVGTASALYSATLTLLSAGNSYNLTSSRVGAGTGTVGHVVFENDNGAVGTIQTSGSSTLYNTSSDYRLKNITGPITTSGAYIDSLNPVEGTWKVDGAVFVGLVAHEAQAVSRTVVATGEKDGDEMQSMDYGNSEFIANIIAELQSLRKRVAQLEQGV